MDRTFLMGTAAGCDGTPNSDSPASRALADVEEVKHTRLGAGHRALTSTLCSAAVLFADCAAAEVTPHTVWTPEARSAMPAWVQGWIPFMFVVFGSGLAFVRKHPEAWWMVGAFALSHLASGLEMMILGTGRLTVGMIAINHCLFWTPAAFCFLARTCGTPFGSPFGIWRATVFATAAFSLVFDYRDAWAFLFASP